MPGVYLIDSLIVVKDQHTFSTCVVINDFESKIYSKIPRTKMISSKGTSLSFGVFNVLINVR